MKKILLSLLAIVFVCSTAFARGGGFGGGGRGGGFSGGSRRGSFSSGRSSYGSSSSRSSGSSSRSSGFGKSSSGNSSSGFGSSSRGYGFGKTTISKSLGYSSQQAPKVYIYRTSPTPSVFLYHPIFGFGYYRSDMSFFEMYMWHQIMFPHPHYYGPIYSAPVTCRVDRDCFLREYCDLRTSPNVCRPR